MLLSRKQSRGLVCTELRTPVNGFGKISGWYACDVELGGVASTYPKEFNKREVTLSGASFLVFIRICTSFCCENSIMDATALEQHLKSLVSMAMKVW
ncbi:hypothetical protein NXX65_00020 [Bacteroides fragilis]|nr:hypothetical protein [Bacteroides fragilis]